MFWVRKWSCYKKFYLTFCPLPGGVALLSIFCMCLPFLFVKSIKQLPPSSLHYFQINNLPFYTRAEWLKLFLITDQNRLFDAGLLKLSFAVLSSAFQFDTSLLGIMLWMSYHETFSVLKHFWLDVSYKFFPYE